MDKITESTDKTRVKTGKSKFNHESSFTPPNTPKAMMTIICKAREEYLA
jgi:hypothetical protein